VKAGTYQLKKLAHELFGVVAGEQNAEFMLTQAIDMHAENPIEGFDENWALAVLEAYWSGEDIERPLVEPDVVLEPRVGELVSGTDDDGDLGHTYGWEVRADRECVVEWPSMWRKRPAAIEVDNRAMFVELWGKILAARILSHQTGEPGPLEAKALAVAAQEAEKEVSVIFSDNPHPNADYLFARFRKVDLKGIAKEEGLKVSGRKADLANRLALHYGGEANVSVTSRKSRLPELHGEVKAYRCSACKQRFEAAEKPHACPLCGYVPGELKVKETKSATIGIPSGVDLDSLKSGTAALVLEILNHGGEIVSVSDDKVKFRNAGVVVHHPKKSWTARHSIQPSVWARAGITLSVTA